MEVCYWALLFMPLVILHHLLTVFVQLANKRGFKQTNKKKLTSQNSANVSILESAARATSVIQTTLILILTAGI
jgi:hypothetical protein